MAVLLALVSSLCGGSADFIGGLTARRLAARTVVGWSQGLALLLIASLVVVVRPALTEWGPLLWAAVAGVAMTVGLTTFYSALSLGTMGVVAPLSSLGVLVPLAWALVVLGEVPASMQVVGALVAVVGIVLASGPELAGAVSARPLVLAGISAIAFGSLNALLAAASTSSVLWTALVLKIGVVGSLLPFLRGAGDDVRAAGSPYVAQMLVAIALLDVGGTILLTHALSLGLLSIVGVVASLYPVATVLLARAFLGERLRVVQQVGVLVAFAGIGLIAGG